MRGGLTRQKKMGKFSFLQSFAGKYKEGGVDKED